MTDTLISDAFPNAVIEALWTDYVRDKLVYNILAQEPAGIGLRLAFDFGKKWRDWPFFNEKAVERLGVDMPDNDRDNLLAVFDAQPDDNYGITSQIAKLMTTFGPPAAAVCFSDAFIVRAREGDEIPDFTTPGALADDFVLNPETKVQEALLCHAVNYLGKVWGRTMAYTYQDGVILFAEQIDDDIERSHGPLSSLLAAAVQLHGSQDPHEVLLAIAGGDRSTVEHLIASYKEAYDTED